MATDLEQLVLSISADNRQMLRVLKKLEGETSATTKKVEKQFDDMARKIDGRIGSIGKGSFQKILGGVTAALGTGQLIELTNVWTDLTSRVNLAAGSIEAGADVMERLGEMARRTYSPLEQTVEAYVDNARALRELGYETNDQLNYTEALNNALVISAAKGQRAAAVQNALMKAMAGGKLAGDDLNTVIQQGGRVAEALAAGLGVGVNQLRALGAVGRITSRDVFKAITSQMESLRQEAEQMPATIADGVQLLQNALLEYVGNADQASGVSARISEALVIMADNFDKTADVALQLAGVLAGALVGRSLATMIAKLGLGTQALAGFTRALMAARSAGGLASAFGGLAAAAGPAGLVIGGAVVSSLVLFSSSSSDASNAADRFAERLAKVKDAAEESAEAIEAISGKNEARKNDLTLEVEAAKIALEQAKDAAVGLFSEIIDNAPRRLVSDDQLASLSSLRDALEENEDRALETENALYALANSDPRFQTLAGQMAPLLRELAAVSAAARQAAADLAALSGSDGAPAPRTAEDASMSALAALRQEQDAYIAEAARRAGLSKEQLALETEIARVRNDALKEGVSLTAQQIRQVAEANIAGNKLRSGGGSTRERADEYERLAMRIREATSAVLAEAEAQRATNPLIEDYGYALEKARIEHDLLQAALKAGVGDTPALRSEISQLAEAYATATVEAAKLGETQDEIRRKAEEMREFQKDLTRGIVDGFIKGKNAAEILSDALSQLGNKLLDLAFNAAFSSSGQGGIFGVLSGLFGGFREKGGPVQAGKAYVVGEKRPELFVPGQSGTILPSVPEMPKASGLSRGSAAQFTYAPTIDMRGASVEAVARLEQVLARDKAEFQSRVVATVRRAQQSRAL